MIHIATLTGRPSQKKDACLTELSVTAANGKTPHDTATHTAIPFQKRDACLMEFVNYCNILPHTSPHLKTQCNTHTEK